MTQHTTHLKRIENAVFNRDEAQLISALDKAEVQKLPIGDVRQSLLNGLDRIRRRLLTNDASLPELLVSLDITAEGLSVLREKEGSTFTGLASIPLVIGVVAGDPHDLGKNIISQIYQSFGYPVTDLGAQVEKEVFIRAVRENDARILALSAMMSTTMGLMPDIIAGVKHVSPEILVMVGGAPLDETLARRYGADGYAESAVTVLESTEKMLAAAGGSGR